MTRTSSMRIDQLDMLATTSSRRTTCTNDMKRCRSKAVMSTMPVCTAPRGISIGLLLLFASIFLCAHTTTARLHRRDNNHVTSLKLNRADRALEDDWWEKNEDVNERDGDGAENDVREEEDTEEPALDPTPTVDPTFESTDAPTGEPTVEPSEDVEEVETEEPTDSPTEDPTKKPQATPEPSPEDPEGDSRNDATSLPTPEPSPEEPEEDTSEPTPGPSGEPTKKPDEQAPTPCTPCSDEASPWMEKPESEGGGGNKKCHTWPYVWNNNCKNGSDYWMRNKFCALTCFEKNMGYPGDNCCPRESRSDTDEPSQEPTEEPTREPRRQPTPIPSQYPTKKPQQTPDPSDEPTEEPRRQPTPRPTPLSSPGNVFEDSGVLDYIGQCYWKPWLCGRCKGDCDNDNECEGNLVCYQRSGNDQAVPGCPGGNAIPDVDYCVHPNDILLRLKPTKVPSSPPTKTPSVRPTPHPAMPSGSIELSVIVEPGDDVKVLLKKCHGDCSTSDDCEEGLKCFKRTDGRLKFVPGCIGEGEAKIDYCYDPRDVVPSPQPSRNPTLRPSPRPSRKPTPRPSAPTGSTKLTVLNEPGDDVKVLLGRCEGDCSTSDDCQEGLKCYKRTDGRLKFVPGCIGEGEAKTDYCYDPRDIVPTLRPTRNPTPRPTMPTGSNKLTRVGNNLGEKMLGRCEGDCDNDRDCFSGLKCMKRTDGRLKSVPGCKSEGARGTDYCYDPRDVIPTPRPTRKPTTRKPSKRPTRPPTVPDMTFTTMPPTPTPTKRPNQAAGVPTAKPNLETNPTLQPSPAPNPKPSSTPTTGRTTTGDSYDGKTASAPVSTPRSPTAMPSTSSLLDDDEIWVNFTPFVLDLTLPRVEERVRKLVKSKVVGKQHHRILIEKTELQRIVGTVLDAEFRENWPNFRGLLIGSKLQEAVELERASIFSYEFTGSALFLRDDRYPAPDADQIEAVIMEALNRTPLLFELRQSTDSQLQSVQSLSLGWSDGRDFGTPPASANKSDGKNSESESKKAVAVAAGLAAFICTVLVGGAVLYFSWRRGSGPFAQNASSSSRPQERQQIEKYEEAPWTGTMTTPRLGIARVVQVMSPAKTVTSPDMSTPARSSDGENGPAPFFGEISVSDIVQSDDLGRSDSDWSVNDVAFQTDFDIQDTVPVAAYPIEQGEPINETGTLGTMSALGDVHASSVLQIDEDVASQATGRSRPNFFDLWKKNPDSRGASDVGARVTEPTGPATSVAEDQVMGVSLTETRRAMESKDMAISAYAGREGVNDRDSLASYHGSSITSANCDEANSSQQSDGIRDYERGYSAQSQLSNIEEVYSTEQTTMVEASLAPGETMALSACLAVMDNMDKDGSDSSIAGGNQE